MVYIWNCTFLCLPLDLCDYCVDVPSCKVSSRIQCVAVVKAFTGSCQWNAACVSASIVIARCVIVSFTISRCYLCPHMGSETMDYARGKVICNVIIVLMA